MISVKKQKLGTSQTALIFSKRLLKYSGLFAVLFIVMFLLYVKSYDVAKQLVLDRNMAKLREGVTALESQVFRAQEIAALVREEDAFQQLFFLNGPPSAEHYIYLIKLRSKLSKLTVTQDLFANSYILFKNNPVFVSNFIASDQYEDAYQRYYHYADTDFQQWQETVFDDPYFMKLLPVRQVYSAYYEPRNFEGMTLLLNNSYYTSLVQKSVFAVDFDKQKIMKLLLYEDQLSDHFISVRTADQTLLTHNYPAGQSAAPLTHMEEVSLAAGTYVTLQQHSKVLGLDIAIGVPQQVFKQHVHSLLRIIWIILWAGGSAIVLLLLYFTLRETAWLKKLLETMPRFVMPKIMVKDEFKYLNDALRAISTHQEQQHDKIKQLNDSIKSSLIKNLLTIGVYTRQEREEVRNLYGTNAGGSHFDCYCVVKAQYRMFEMKRIGKQDGQLIHQAIGWDIERAFRTTLALELEAVTFHSDERIFILFLHPEQVEQQMAEIRDKLLGIVRMMSGHETLPVKVKIGISSVMNELSHARTAYQQANYALLLHENDSSGGVYAHEPDPADEQRFSSFDIAIALKLYDALVAGETSAVAQIFDDTLQGGQLYKLSRQEQLQIYFSFRQTLCNARSVIMARKGAEEEQALVVPEYHGESGDMHLQAAMLKETALALCAYVAQRRRSTNENLKLAIVQLISEQYTNPALSAAQIADQLLISEKYVYSYFKEHTGKSLGKYIEDLRVTRSEQLLRETDYSNKKILELCGFGSENTYYRAFSKKHGVSPTVWRSQNQ